MKLSRFSKTIATMFTDKMSITRYVETQNEDGTIDTALSSSALYNGVPCRISFLADESPKDKEVDDVPVKNVPKIFCGAGTDIKAGDLVKVERFDDAGNIIATYEGKAGLPSVFVTHKEVLFSIERSA